MALAVVFVFMVTKYMTLASAEDEVGASICTVGPPVCWGPNTESSVAGFVEKFGALCTITAAFGDDVATE